MTTSVKTQLATSIGEAVFSEIVSRSSRYYYYVGKNLPYNITDTLEEPVNNLSYENTTRSEIVYLKEIKSSDVAFITKRYDWVINNVYDIYDDSYSISNLAYSGASTLEDARFYVVTDTFNVYKCISNNNNSKSTVKPVYTDSEQFTTADGYVWKFMLNVPIGLRNKFLYGDYMPISTSIKNSFYSSGNIDNIKIDAKGSGYTGGATTLTISGDGYLENNPYIINSLNITNPGSGYTIAPAITFSSPVVISGSEIQALGTATISGDSLSTAVVDAIGYGYDSIVSVIVAPPFVGDLWVPSVALINDDYVYYNFNYYKVVGSGVCGTVAPTHITGTVASGAISLLFVGRQAQISVNVTKTEASISPIISGGEIIGVTINNAGIGYTWAKVNVFGDGTGAELSVDLSVGNLDTLQSTVELLAVDGSVDFIKVVNAGSGYSVASVNITGDGIGATATPIIVNGSVVGINIITRGSGYRFVNVTITGDGTGATARAILPPFGGHGKNAVMELYSSKLMLFASFSDSRIGGVTLTNDYRQVGIIKNPKKFGYTYSYASDNGHSCYVGVFGGGDSVAISGFLKDDIFTTISGKSFSIVAIENSKIVFHSKTNSILLAGETLTNTRNTITLAPSSVIAPSVDKYSGEMIYIDNRAPFIASDDQSVSLRTIIEY